MSKYHSTYYDYTNRGKTQRELLNIIMTVRVTQFTERNYNGGKTLPESTNPRPQIPCTKSEWPNQSCKRAD